MLLVAQLCPTLRDPMGCILPGSSVHGILLWHEYWGGLLFPSPADLPNPGIEPRSPALQADALPSEPRLDPIVGNFTGYHQIASQTDGTSSHSSQPCRGPCYCYC